jgi:hypothetical protein
MKPVLSSLRHLILGETWSVPIGVGAALLLAVLMRASLSEGAWETGGGFALAALVIAALAQSLKGSR